MHMRIVSYNMYCIICAVQLYIGHCGECEWMGYVNAITKTSVNICQLIAVPSFVSLFRIRYYG